MKVIIQIPYTGQVERCCHRAEERSLMQNAGTIRDMRESDCKVLVVTLS